MKTLQRISIFVWSITALQAQTDTLIVNETHLFSLLFPEPITNAVTGHSNYTFGYNTDTPGRLGLLQGHAGTDSNLLVLTSDGLAYSFYLTYRKQLGKSHRFIDKNDAIGNVLIKKRLDSLGQQEKSRLQAIVQSDTVQYRKASHYFLERSSKVLKSKRKNGIILRLCEVGYCGKETYLVLEIENKSKIDFDVDYIQIFKEQGSGSKKSSYQKLLSDTLYRYRMPSRVPTAYKQRFVCVIPKVTLGSRENLLVELREKQGNRQVVIRSK